MTPISEIGARPDPGSFEPGESGLHVEFERFSSENCVTLFGNRSKRASGFTLVELLIVLAILAASATVVVLTLPDERGQLRRQAERFAARLQHAEQEAVLTNRRIAVRVDAKGYGFRVQRAGQWQPLEAAGLESAVWDERVTPVLEHGDGLTARFDPAGLTEPLRVVLTLDAARVAVILEASGKVRVSDEAAF